MSKPISEKKSPRRNRTSPEAKLAIVTALITAITTVLVSIIGIAPQIYKGQKEEIDKLKEENKDLENEKKNLSDEINKLKGKYTISGTIKKNNSAMGKAGAFLLPTGSEVQSDDNGLFRFSNMHRTAYFILVDDKEASFRLLIDPDADQLENKIEEKGIVVRYKFDEEE